MRSQKQHIRFRHFCNLVHLFLDMNLILVSRKLIPEEYLDQTLTPDGIRQNFESLLFGGVLFQCACENCLSDYHLIFCVFLCS